MNGLDLFSGIGGNSLGLRDYIKTIAYCEADRHAQAVLLSRMEKGDIAFAPIWDDITTLQSKDLDIPIDIILGGFPCQDISVAGKGAGITEQTRSGLFFQVARLIRELKPTFVFLENVPAIRTRGLDVVLQELTQAGYDCRWTMLSASSIGANHQRERWFLLAYSVCSDGRRGTNATNSQDKKWESSSPRRTALQSEDRQQCPHNTESGGEIMADSPIERLEGNERRTPKKSRLTWNCSDVSNAIVRSEPGNTCDNSWWAIEPNVGRVANGVPYRVERIKRLGNAVVPEQAKKAFEILMGII